MSRILAFFRTTALWILLLPYAFTFLGIASNQAVIWANNDTFPVKMNLVKIKAHGDDVVQLPDGTIMLDDVHCLMTNKTHLNLLGDIFDLHDYIASIGDLLIFTGDWLSTFAIFVWIAIAVRKIRAA